MDSLSLFMDRCWRYNRTVDVGKFFSLASVMYTLKIVYPPDRTQCNWKDLDILAGDVDSQQGGGSLGLSCQHNPGSGTFCCPDLSLLGLPESKVGYPYFPG
jgi:hypothetical protein